MSKHYTEKELAVFADKYLIWRPQRYVFTEHPYLCYIEEKKIETHLNKARFIQALMLCLRNNRGKICSIPADAIIRSPDIARGISPDTFAYDNGYSSRALMDFDWVNPKLSKFCVDGPGFMNTYLSTRYGKTTRRNKSKPLYFLDESDLHSIFTEFGANDLLSLYKSMKPDNENYGHNNNMMHFLAGILHYNLQLLKENAILRENDRLLHKKLDALNQKLDDFLKKHK